MAENESEDEATSPSLRHSITPSLKPTREHRRRRLRRRGKRAYIRSVYFLPSMATLGNAICGFAAMYIAAFDPMNVGDDPLAHRLVGVHVSRGGVSHLFRDDL